MSENHRIPKKRWELISAAFVEKGSNARHMLKIQKIVGARFVFSMFLRLRANERNGHKQLHGNSLAT
jgi:hypothetical protein